MITGLLATSLLLAGDPPSASRLAVIRTAPDFALIDADGRKTTLKQFRGKVVLVSFIFTTCSGSCPATTSRMVQVQDRLKERGLLKGDRVRLISITLDPARDTPTVLARYLKMYDADPAHWTCLTGPRERVEKVIADWGMWAKPAANGQLDHPSRIFLVDQQAVSARSTILPISKRLGLWRTSSRCCAVSDAKPQAAQRKRRRRFPMQLLLLSFAQ